MSGPRESIYRWFRSHVPAPLRRALKALHWAGKMAEGSRPRGSLWLPVRLAPGIELPMLLPEVFHWVSYRYGDPGGARGSQDLIAVLEAVLRELHNVEQDQEFDLGSLPEEPRPGQMLGLVDRYTHRCLHPRKANGFEGLGVGNARLEAPQRPTWRWSHHTRSPHHLSERR